MRIEVLALVPLAIAAALLAALASCFALTYPLMRPGRVRFAKFPVDFKRVMVVSDLHCRGQCPTFAALLRCAAEVGVDAVIVAGDLVNDGRGLSLKEALRDLASAAPSGAPLVVYVTSRASHDPLIERAKAVKLGPLKVLAMPVPARFSVGGLEVYVTHGDTVVRNGLIAFLLAYALSAIGIKMGFEKVARAKAAISRNGWLVLGHTHIGGVDEEYRVANAGGWRVEWGRGLKYWRRATLTALLIDERGVRILPS